MHRLRDLTRRQALVAVALVALLVAPFVVSVTRAADREYLPSGDDALIGLRALDVGTADTPLIGQPSTSHLYGPEDGTSHPGPIEFWWLALPERLLGPPAGMILGAAAFNLAAVLIAAWVVYRRAGPAVGAWGAVLLSLVLWSEGSAILTDPISSSAGGLPLLALAALTWAVLDGDWRLLPLGALVGSWVAQQHLSITMPAAALVLAAVVGAALSWWLPRRAASRRGRARPDPPDGSPRWPWAVAALVVGLVCWSPVLVQQVTGDPGNLTAVATYAREGDTASIGPFPALRQGIRSLGYPPLLVRHDLEGDHFFNGPLTPWEVLVAGIAVALLVAIAVRWWWKERTLALLPVTAGVLLVAGMVNGASIPDSVEAFRTSFYRWTWAVAWLAWLAFGWAAVQAAREARRDRPRRLVRRIAPAAPALAVAVMAVALVAQVQTNGFDDERRDETGFVAMRAMRDAATDEAAAVGAEEVTLVLRGRSAVLATGSAVALELVHDGFDVTVAEQEARFWGDDRVFEPGDEPGDLILLLASGRGSVPEGPGRTIATYDLAPDLRPVLGPLADAVRGADVVPAPGARALIGARYEGDEVAWVEALMANLATQPEEVLTDERALDLIEAGYLAEPALDLDEVARLRNLLPAATVNEDDVFELRVLTPDELAEVLPPAE